MAVIVDTGGVADEGGPGQPGRTVTGDEAPAGATRTRSQPGRTELVIDLDTGTISAGPHTGQVGNAGDTDAVLVGYLDLVYEMRGLEPGAHVPIRQLDLDVLSTALGAATGELEDRLDAFMVVDAASGSRRWVRIIVPAAAAGVLAIGAVALLQTSSGDGESEPTTDVPAGVPTPVTPEGDVGLIPPLVLEIDPETGEAVEVPPGEAEIGDAVVVERDSVDDEPGEIEVREG